MMVEFLHIAYQSLYVFLAPLICLILLSRRDTRTRLLHMWALRRPSNQQTESEETIDWLHAVSFGETKVCLDFIRTGLRHKQINQPILFTTTIQDALDYFEENIAKLKTNYPNLRWESYLMPLDFQPCIKKFINKKKIRNYFLFETDFWPGTLSYLKSKESKIYLINGRISYKIARFYGRIPTYSAKLFQNFSHCFLQSETDSKRLIDLGVNPDCISITGNAKFDFLPLIGLEEHDNQLTRRQTSIIIFGSWHLDELNILIKISEFIPDDFQIWIAPRVLNELSAFERKIFNLQGNYSLYSKCKDNLPETRFTLIDTMGKLSKLYQYAQIAIVGGSFNQTGGHNFLEPIACQCPVIVGPYMRNFQDDIQEFLDRNIIQQAQNSDHLKEILDYHISCPDEVKYQAMEAYKYLQTKMGSLDRTWKKIIQEN